MIGKLVGVARGSLLELTIEHMDSDTIYELADMKLHLKALTLGCNGITGECILQLCRSLAPHLENLVLQTGREKVMTSELVVAISAACSQLRSIHVSSECALMADIGLILGSVLFSCPFLATIHCQSGNFHLGSVNRCDVKLFRNHDHQRVCELTVSHCMGDKKDEKFSSLCDALQENGIAIRRVKWANIAAESHLLAQIGG